MDASRVTMRPQITAAATAELIDVDGPRAPHASTAAAAARAGRRSTVRTTAL